MHSYGSKFVSTTAHTCTQTIPSTISPDELEYFPEDIIDTGNFGSVYFGKVRELPAAIKVLKDSNMTQSSIDTFTREVEIVKWVSSISFAYQIDEVIGILL